MDSYSSSNIVVPTNDRSFLANSAFMQRVGSGIYIMPRVRFPFPVSDIEYDENF